MLKYRGIRINDEAGPCSVYRDEDGSVTVLDPSRSQRIVNHSPTGFNWGYFGSGPAQLALGILLDVTGEPETAERHHQEFKFEFIGGWGDKWEITAEEVKHWLKNAKKS